MASTSIGMQLLVHGLLALAVLHLHSLGAGGEGGGGGTVAALPITSRPIEAWEEWLRLPYEQNTLQKEKKVIAKSIFTLPFRHCPPGHKLYKERCISETNIDPTDVLKQELLGLLGGGTSGSGAPIGNENYDYSENLGDSESEELFYDVPLVPLVPLLQTGHQVAPLSSGGAAGGTEDQALPSEDAPLKFNLFEKMFPTAPETSLEPNAASATAATETATTTTTKTTTTTTATATISTAIATATPMPTPTISTRRDDAPKTQQQPDNRFAEGAQDLQADASNAVPSTTSLSIPTSSSSSSSVAFSDIGNIDAIILPAGVPLDELVTSSISDEGESNADASANADANANAEADLAQLLKVDAFLPAYGSSVELLPPFSHRRVSPLLSADLDADDSATDIVPTVGDAEPTMATETNAVQPLSTPTTLSSSSSSSSSTYPPARGEEQELGEGENRLVLKKSKVQPVATATATTVAIATRSATATTTAATETETTMATAIGSTTPITTAAAVTTTTTKAATTPTATAAASAAAATETEVAAIHQDANGNARDDDRFYYQQFARKAAASSTSSSSSTTVSTTTTDSDLDVLNDMVSSDNLMTNTIGGQGESNKAASQINFEQELRIINELVKGKRLLSQRRQQQQPTTGSNSGDKTTEKATKTTIVDSSTQSFSTAATSSDATTAATATESTTFWSKLLPMLGMSTTAEASTPTATTVQTANVVESSIAPTATAATVTATAGTTTTESTTNLSINSNRNNRNSQIVSVDSIVKTTTPTTPATSSTTTTPSTEPNSSNSDDKNYTPFWWLPNIGWRLDRQVDRNGEDRSLLLRFFGAFGANASDTATTLSARR